MPDFEIQGQNVGHNTKKATEYVPTADETSPDVVSPSGGKTPDKGAPGASDQSSNVKTGGGSVKTGGSKTAGQTYSEPPKTQESEKFSFLGMNAPTLGFVLILLALAVLAVYYFAKKK